jgi:hypothetical protein
MNASARAVLATARLKDLKAILDELILMQGSGGDRFEFSALTAAITNLDEAIKGLDRAGRIAHAREIALEAQRETLLQQLELSAAMAGGKELCERTARS